MTVMTRKTATLAALFLLVGWVLGGLACGGGNGSGGGDTPDGGLDTAGSDVDPSDSGVAGDFEVAQSDKSRITDPLVEGSDLEALVAGNTEFAFALYQAIRDRDGNLFYSPHSISIALAMTYAGARGETATQMADAMSFALPNGDLHPAFNWLDLELATRNELPPEEEGEGFILRVANALWGQTGYPFLDAFLDLLAENYGAGMQLLDFSSDPESARATINEWVEEQTEDRIQDLLPPGSIDTLTRLVLTNAIYFFAPWEFPFDPADTAEGTFHLLDGGSVTVDMMSQVETFAYVDGDGFQAVELPYNGRDLSMVLLLPDAGAFETFESGLDAAGFAAIVETLGGSYSRLDLSFPKFEFVTEINLNEVLQGMGMVDAFDPVAADFSGIAGNRDLFISGVLHKAFVAVDEEGTEAAAATAVVVGTTSVPPPPTPVTFDRPFIFAIRDIPTGAILFVGRVVEP